MKAHRIIILGVTILLSMIVVLVVQANRETLGQPDQLVIGEYAYFTNYDPPITAVVNTTTYEIAPPIDLSGYGCEAPEQVAMHPDGVRVFVSCYLTNQLLVIDTNSNTVVASILNIPNAHGIAFTNDGSYALVGSRFIWAPITVVDTIAYTVVGSIDINGYAYKLASHPVMDVVYAAVNDGSSGSILVVETNTFTIIDEIPIGDYGDYLTDVEVSPDGQWVYTVYGYTGELVVINATTHEIYTSVPVLNGPNGLAVSPDGSEVYVMSYNAVEVINTSSWTVIETIDGLNNLGDASVTCDGAKLFVTTGSYYFTAIDLLTYMFIDNIQFGAGMYTYGVAICPPFLASNVALLPESQSGSGAPGQVVAYSETLRNTTGNTDTFDLSFSNNLWDTNLSDTTLGPLANGETATFIISVTIPADASWYLTDTVVVTATSVTSPTEFFDSASLTTQAFAPPQISVDPTQLSSSQYVGDILNQEMIVGNGNGITLTYGIKAGSWREPPLENVLEALEQNYPGVIATIPNRFDFSEGEIGYYIGYGGNHMYDGGNYLSTNLGGAIEYSNGHVWSSPYFGVSGRYFTRKYPGLFVLAADLQNVDYFEINGGLGANSSGFADGTLLQTDRYGVTYYGFLKRVHDASVPSVNHLIIVVDNPVANHTFYSSTDDDYHQVDGLSGSTRLYYLLFAGQDGYFIDNDATLEVMESFLDALELQTELGWLSTDPVSGTIPTLSQTPVQVTFDATAMQPGEYTSGLTIDSNDPFSPSIFMTVTMNVSPTTTMGWVEGTIMDAGSSVPLEASLQAIGQPYLIACDLLTGYYKLWLEQGSYNLQASASGYVTQTTPVNITSQVGVIRDFNLAPNVPQVGIEPGALTADLITGQSETQLLTLANQGPAPLDYTIYEDSVFEDSVLELHLDEPPGRTTFFDTSGYGNNAACSDDACPVAGNPGAVGTALGFDGVDDYLQIPHNAELDQIEEQYKLSIAAWVYLSKESRFPIIDQYEADNVGGWGLYMDGYSLAFRANVYSTDYCYHLFNTNQWHHLAVVYDLSQGTIQYFVDGGLVCANSYWGYIRNTSGEPLYIGHYPEWDPYSEEEYAEGLIDELYIFNRPLSEEEIVAVYQSGGGVSWFSVDPQSGSLPTGSSSAVEVAFDATAMQPGAYETTLFVNNNDPLNPTIQVPVIMTVLAPVEPLSVEIVGPKEGLVGESYAFTATVSPISTTLPITYSWQASGQSSVTHTSGITDTVSFTWQLSGTKFITVTASNSVSSVQASTVVNVMQPEKRIYLPVILQSASPSLESIYWRRQEPI